MAFLMMSAGSRVQTNGVGFSFQRSMYRWMCFTRALTVSKDPRRTDLRVRMLNQASTMFNHDAPVGVKWKWTRGCASSHAWTSGVLCVDELLRMTCRARVRYRQLRTFRNRRKSASYGAPVGSRSEWHGGSSMDFL
jgi:hypothetical protein